MSMTMTVDLGRLLHEIHMINVECTRLKKGLRARWLRPMSEDQRRLVRLRRTLTERYVLLAASRGRLHVVRPPRGRTAEPWDAVAWNAKVAARVLPSYERPVAPPEASR